VQLTKPPTFVLFSPDRPNGIQLPDLPPNVVPILPNNKIAPMRITVNGKRFTVSRLQLRLLPGWAMTIDKCQGQNMPKSITDLSSPPSAGNRLTASHVYVALSRSQGRDDLRMLRPLTDALKKVLSNHIGSALRNDDRRLTDQARDTRRLFESNQLFDTVRYATQYDKANEGTSDVL
jgi:hypothetical protein